MLMMYEVAHFIEKVKDNPENLDTKSLFEASVRLKDESRDLHFDVPEEMEWFLENLRAFLNSVCDACPLPEEEEDY